MRLAVYLQERGLTNAEFAKATGLSEGTISMLCRGQSWMSRATAERIFIVTKGKVTPTDFLLNAERHDIEKTAKCMVE